MTTIELQISDETASQMSTQLIKNYLEEQLEYLKFHILSQEINNGIIESGIDLDKELLSAKKEAWNEYKNKYLKDILQ